MENYILPKKQAIIVFFVFAFGYFLSCLLRAITATLSPVLTSEFNLLAADLGLLAGGYFLGFASMQIPLGYLLDKYGPKKIVSSFLLIALVGTGSFALAESFSGLLISRILIGVGVSACLMAPLTGYRIWYAENQQQRANSWMLMIASLGFLSSTLPVQLLLPSFGWRWIFGGIAILILISIFLMLVFIPKWNLNKNKELEKPSNSGTLSEVWKNRFFISVIPMGLFNYGGLMAIQTLWAGPWMTRVAGYTPLQSATGLFWINVTMLVSFFFWGYFLPKISGIGFTAKKILKLGLPISFSVNCSMKNNDFPKTVHILVLDNPFPEIAKFYFTPFSGEASVSIRIRMRTSSNIIAIAEMADGTVGETKSYVDVTIGACS